MGPVFLSLFIFLASPPFSCHRLPMQKPSFAELNLSPELLKAVTALGFEQASHIQAAAIPVLREGRDLVGQSQTGSGKTAAFTIPALERIDLSDHRPQILILCPTRELATQVAADVHRMGAFMKGLQAIPIYGGAGYERQFSELRKGVHLVVGTPGRIIDHLERKTLNLGALKMVILDEADRMLDMGFRDDIQRILEATPESRQTVFFSATMSTEIRKMIKHHAKDPATVKIEEKAMTVTTVEQLFFEVRPRLKVEALIRLIDYYGFKFGIIFCNTQRMVEDLADALKGQGIVVDRLHGGMTQNQRTRVMNQFKKAEFEFLVATDVAGRGIDVDHLEVVMNYDMPYDSEDYVHRIGRTGRAGRKGVAITFVSGREIHKLRFLERFTRSTIRLGSLPSYEEAEEKKSNVMFERLRDLLEKGSHRAQLPLVDRLLDQGYNSAEIASASLSLLLGKEESAPAEKKKPAADKPLPSAGESKPPRRAEPTPSLPAEESGFRDKPRPTKEPSGPTDAPKSRRESPRGREETPRPSRPAARGMNWVQFNLGREDDVTPRDLMALMSDEVGLPPKSIGLIDFQDNTSFIQIAQNDMGDLEDALDGLYCGEKQVVAKLWQAGPPSRGKPPRGKGYEGSSEKRPGRRFDSPGKPKSRKPKR